MTMKRKMIALIIAASFALPFGASAKSLLELQGMQFDEDKTAMAGVNIEGKEELRQQAQRDAALTVGAQHGYKAMIEFLKDEVIKHEEEMDDLFDFNTLMKLTSDGYNELYLLPPVITEVEDVISLSADARTLELAGKVVEIVKPERLVTSAPNWRQYLIFDRDVEVPEVPNVLLPKNPLEKEKWKEWVLKGWNSGIDQADREFERRVHKLGRDFKGMQTYLRLTQQSRASKPIISSSYTEVKGTGSKVYEQSRLIQLAKPVELNTNANDWNTFILDNRGSFRTPLEKEKEK